MPVRDGDYLSGAIRDEDGLIAGEMVGCHAGGNARNDACASMRSKNSATTAGQSPASGCPSPASWTRGTRRRRATVVVPSLRYDTVNNDIGFEVHVYRDVEHLGSTCRCLCGHDPEGAAQSAPIDDCVNESDARRREHRARLRANRRAPAGP